METRRVKVKKLREATKKFSRDGKYPLRSHNSVKKLFIMLKLSSPSGLLYFALKRCLLACIHSQEGSHLSNYI